MSKGKMFRISGYSDEDMVEYLQRMLMEARYEYYVLSKPILTDGFYDRLEKDLKSYIAARPDLDRPDLAINTVGSSNPGDYDANIRI